MNKISKKIVALVTMAAFVLTLVPFAAFAAPVTGAGVALDASYLAVVNANGVPQAEKTVDVGDPVNTQFFVLNNAGEMVNANLATTAGDVAIWATTGEKDGIEKAVSSMTVTSENATLSGTQQNVYCMDVPAVYGTAVTLQFAKAGTYYIHTGVVNQTGSWNDGITECDVYSVVTVDDAAQVINQIDLQAPNRVFPNRNGVVNRLQNATLTTAASNATATLNTNWLNPNGIDSYTITGTAYSDAGVNFISGEKINLTSNSSHLVLVNSQVTTNPNGTFPIQFKIDKAGTYEITIHNSDRNFTLTVTYPTTNDGIKTVVSNGETLLAGTDTINYNGFNTPANYADAVEFEITDSDNGVVTGAAAIANEPAANAAAANHADYLEVTAPEGSKITAADLQLVWDAGKNAYTLQYIGNDAARDLIPGEYTVKVSLLSSKNATAKMTFAKYGTTQSVVLDMTAVPTNAAGDAVQQEDITDQVKLGRTVTVQARYVDENGVKINAQDVTYGFDGKAVDSTFVRANRFNTRADQIFNESLFGTTITVTAFDSNKKEIASQELTVVDAYTENSLEFDKTTGAVDTNNNVTVSVVDANGKVVPVTGVLDAYVDAQSNADADVTVKVAKDMTNGADGKLILNSDKDTTADIVVSVKAGNAQYVGTLHYTFGDVAGAGTSVVMTIDSKTILVNNEMDTLDVAPYVKDSRTYVPLRALAQSFGAEVNWDEKTGEITVDGNGTKVVLEVGKTTYTVNDNEKTMDVAPELDSAAGRTLVPVRFVAEALGYTVTAIYGADGTTSSVYFTM